MGPWGSLPRRRAGTSVIGSGRSRRANQPPRCSRCETPGPVTASEARSDPVTLANDLTAWSRSWSAAALARALFYGVLLMGGLTGLLLGRLFPPGNLQLALWVAVTALIVYGVYRLVKRRVRAVRLLCAPDRVSIDSLGVVAYFDHRPGPAGSRRARVPFSQFLEIRLRGGAVSVRTKWAPRASRRLVRKAWTFPPTVSDPRHGDLPGAALLTLTEENGRLLRDAWSRYRPLASIGQAVPSLEADPRGLRRRR